MSPFYTQIKLAQAMATVTSAETAQKCWRT